MTLMKSDEKIEMLMLYYKKKVKEILHRQSNVA